MSKTLFPFSPSKNKSSVPSQPEPSSAGWANTSNSMVKSSGRYSFSSIKGCILESSILIAFLPAMLTTSTSLPLRRSHLEGNSPSFSPVTSSLKKTLAPRWKSLLAWISAKSTISFALSSPTASSLAELFPDLLLSFLSVALLTALLMAFSTFSPTAFSTACLALSPRFLRMPWALALPHRSIKLETSKITFFISFCLVNIQTS